MNDRQARAAQSKLNMTSRKTVHYCIPAAQLYVREVTRPSFSRRLKGVACETSSLPLFLSLSLSLTHPYPMYIHVHNLLGDDQLLHDVYVIVRGGAMKYHQREGAALASDLAFVLKLPSEVLRELATWSRSLHHLCGCLSTFSVNHSCQCVMME